MPLSEIDELRKENARLRKIIELLFEKYVPDSTDSSHITPDGGNSRTFSSYIDERTVVNRTGDSHIEERSGNSSSYYSHILKYNRKNSSEISNIAERNGNSRFDSSDTENKTNEIIAGSGPPAFEVSHENIELLARHIQIKGRVSGRKRIAKLLLHIGSGGIGGNGTLCHVLGIGKTGVTKLIYQMKKQGLLKRIRMKEYILTPKARQWMTLVLGTETPGI